MRQGLLGEEGLGLGGGNFYELSQTRHSSLKLMRFGVIPEKIRDDYSGRPSQSDALAGGS